MKITEIFTESSGKLSACRLVFLLWGVGILAVWVITSISNKALQPIDNSVVTLFGLIVTGKVIQRPLETPKKEESKASSI